MLHILPRYIFYYVFFVLLQVLILNNIQFSGYLNPYMYILFVLVLPFETPNWLLLILASVLGLSIDMFMDTPGVHMAAALVCAFLRPSVLRKISPRDSYELGTLPLPSYYGFEWFIKYAVILVLIHHLSLFLLEVFSFKSFFSILVKTLGSSLFTLILILITMMFGYQKKRRI